jgi:hypothetical protein
MVRLRATKSVKNFLGTIETSFLDVIRLRLLTYSEIKQMRVREFYSVWRLANKRKWFDNA